MQITKRYTCLLLLTLLTPIASAQASEAVNELLQQYRQQGVQKSSAEAGQLFWNHQATHTGSGQPRSCSTCHTSNVRQYGKHATTGKEIKPLAPSVLSKRLTNISKINKWFKRNCNWTLNRECSAQEKADVLTYLSSQ